MKKLFVAIAALAIAVAASAQDYNSAVEAFNSGATALEENNKQEALNQFRSALTQASACVEDEAVDLIAKCKEYIPQILMSIAKEQINAGEYDAAIVTLGEASSVAKEYGQGAVAENAEDLASNALLRKGTALLKAKDFAAAIEALQPVADANPADGQIQLLLGQAKMQNNDADGAIVALEAAYNNGKAEQAGKLLSTLFLKQGMALVKGGKAAEAIEVLNKSNSYGESANAYKLIASAALKLNKSGDAVNAYKKYLELDPNAKDASDVMFTIAATAQKSGDKATAIEYYKKLSGDAKYSQQAAQQLGNLQK